MTKTFKTSIPMSKELAALVSSCSDKEIAFIESEAPRALTRSLLDHFEDELLNGPKPKLIGPELPIMEIVRREIVAANIVTGLFCPLCGKQPVLVEDSEGDYYDGPTHLCTICGETFRGPG